MSDVDTAPIVADITRARADMAGTLEELGDRLSPQKLKARLKMQLQAKVADIKERINPIRIVQRKMGATGRSVGPGRRPVLTVRTADRERLPALKK